METRAIESLYIHFPFCKHLCNYCDFYKKVPSSRKTEVENFQNLLSESYSNLLKFVEKERFNVAPLKTIYIGGGTPSLWGEEGAYWLERFFKKNHIEFADDIEFTIEMNPGSLTKEQIRSWQEIGVNRFSVGLQTLNGQCLKLIDRVHSIDDSFEALEIMRDLDLNFSCDFMLGLPGSIPFNRSITEELNLISSYKPKHISLYILTTKDNYKNKNLIPGESYIAEEYLEMSQHLKEKGYEHYEVSNFSLPGYQSKHNLSYWKTGPMLALGPSATGLLVDERKGKRFKWLPNMLDFTIEELDPDALRLEKFYMSFRTSMGLNGSSYGEDFARLVSEWRSAGYIESDGLEKVVLNSRGYLLIDSLMDQVFSRTQVL